MIELLVYQPILFGLYWFNWLLIGLVVWVVSIVIFYRSPAASSSMGGIS